MKIFDVKLLQRYADYVNPFLARLNEFTTAEVAGYMPRMTYNRQGIHLLGVILVSGDCSGGAEKIAVWTEPLRVRGFEGFLHNQIAFSGLLFAAARLDKEPSPLYVSFEVR